MNYVNLLLNMIKSGLLSQSRLRFIISKVGFDCF